MIVKEERIGGQRLILGDCRLIAPTLRGIDHVMSDPPYGEAATHANHLSGVTLRDGTPAGQALGFDGISGAELVALARQWCELAARWVVFSCEWKDAHRLDEAGLLVRLGIWRKPDGAPQFTGDRPGMGWEAVAICHRNGRKRWNGGGKHAFWMVPKGIGDGHPTQKPLRLVEEWLLDFTDQGDAVLDPFMGSGTALVACERLARRGTGIELDPQWFDLACRRVDEIARQPQLFEPPAPKPVQEGLDL